MKIELTWDKFGELKILVDAISHSHGMGVKKGELEDTIMRGKWTEDGVEIEID